MSWEEKMSDRMEEIKTLYDNKKISLGVAKKQKEECFGKLKKNHGIKNEEEVAAKLKEGRNKIELLEKKKDRQEDKLENLASKFNKEG